MTNNKESWEVVDGYGNIKCPVCNKKQSPNFDGDCCIYCCSHEEFILTYGTGDCGQKELEITCTKCGADDWALELDHETIFKTHTLRRK